MGYNLQHFQARLAARAKRGRARLPGLSMRACTFLVLLAGACGGDANKSDAGSEGEPGPGAPGEDSAPEAGTAAPGAADAGTPAGDDDAGADGDPVEAGADDDAGAACTPTADEEVCGNATDDDCNGTVDDGCDAAVNAIPFVNGCAVFEVEGILGDNPPGGWKYRTTEPACAAGADCSFSGTGYYVFEPGQGCGQEKSDPANALSFELSVSQAGVYHMAWRNLEDNQTNACEGDRNNDTYAAFPSTASNAAFRSPFKVFHGGTGNKWDWSSSYDIASLDPDKAAVCVELTPGRHKLEVRGRSQNHHLDKIAVCRYDTLSACRGANSNLYEGLPLSPRM